MGPVLIDMETFGIASTMAGMGLHNRVLVLRVATDALTTKDGQGDTEQGDLLRAQLPALSAALSLIME